MKMCYDWKKYLLKNWERNHQIFKIFFSLDVKYKQLFVNFVKNLLNCLIQVHLVRFSFATEPKSCYTSYLCLAVLNGHSGYWLRASKKQLFSNWILERQKRSNCNEAHSWKKREEKKNLLCQVEMGINVLGYCCILKSQNKPEAPQQT